MIPTTASPGSMGILCYGRVWSAWLTDTILSQCYGKEFWQNCGRKLGKNILYRISIENGLTALTVTSTISPDNVATLSG